MTTPAPKPEDIEATYGFVALLARSVPEVGGLLNQARAEQWTTDRFNMAIANTNWWKATPEQSRRWLVQQIGDPASANRAMQTGGEQISGIAARYGFTAPPPAEARQLWLNAQLAGYDESLTEKYVFNHMFNGWGSKGPGGVAGGEFGQRAMDARQIALAYGYNPQGLDSEIEQAVAGAIRGGQDRTVGLASWRSKLEAYAKSKYSAYAERIASGETVADIALPYREAMADVLELNINSVNLSDPLLEKWLTAGGGSTPTGGVSGRQNSTGGAATASRAVSVWEAKQELRKDPRWQYTRNAWRASADVATAVGKAFGLVG